MFFSISCPICAQHNPTIARWGKTLPRGWSLEQVPVATPDKESVIATRAYYAALEAAPSRIDLFLEAAYTAVHDKGMNPNDPGTWAVAAKAAGISNFDTAWKNVRKEQVLMAHRKLVDYEIAATPSIAIGGRYVITPEDTNGDAGLFMQLANGMVSKAIGR